MAFILFPVLDDWPASGYARRMVSRVPKLHSSYAVAFAVGCLGIAVFSGMDAVVKGLTLAIGTYNTMLWRSFAGVVVSGVPWLVQRPVRPSRAAFLLHIERGAISAVMAILVFLGVGAHPRSRRPLP